MPLTDRQIQSAAAKNKYYKITDGGGMYLLISPSGRKLWRMNYRFARKGNTLSFGAYPKVSLTDARIKRDNAKSLLDAGIDPSAIHRQEKTEGMAQAARQLEATRFMLDNNGGLYFHFGKRSVALSADETLELLAFLDDTRNAIGKDTRNAAH